MRNRIVLPAALVAVVQLLILGGLAVIGRQLVCHRDRLEHLGLDVVELSEQHDTTRKSLDVEIIRRAMTAGEPTPPRHLAPVVPIRPGGGR